MKTLKYETGILRKMYEYSNSAVYCSDLYASKVTIATHIGSSPIQCNLLFPNLICLQYDNV